jgi:hypothetical protein
MQLSLIPEIVAPKPTQKLPDRQLMLTLFARPKVEDIPVVKIQELFVFGKE